MSICYTDRYLTVPACLTVTVPSLWPTAARREHLVYSKDFLCVCDRCQDETENETFISAIRCTKCPGFFLPDNPIGLVWEGEGMEVDNTSADCEGKWLCNECHIEAPKVRPGSLLLLLLLFLHLLLLLLATLLPRPGVPGHRQQQGCLSHRSAGGGGPDASLLRQVPQDVRQGERETAGDGG